MTDSQAAAHESWLVRCSPRTPDFSREQSASIPLILQESGDATCTRPCDPPSPIVFARQLCGNKEEYIWLLRGIEPGLPRCYILMLCYKFHRFIGATAQD